MIVAQSAASVQKNRCRHTISRRFRSNLTVIKREFGVRHVRPNAALGRARPSGPSITCLSRFDRGKSALLRRKWHCPIRTSQASISASPLLIAATCSAQTRSSPISDALCAVVHDGEVRRPTVRTRCTSLSPCLSQPVLTARSLLAAPPSWRPRGPPSRARRWRGPAGASCTEIARAWGRAASLWAPTCLRCL